MRKSSSDSSRGARPAVGRQAFRKDESPKPYNKNAKPFKKNYDGRGPASGDAGASRSSKPYSGRVTDSDRPKRPFDKPSFGNENSQGGRFDADRKPRKEYDKPRKEYDKPGRAGNYDQPSGDRPKRPFDKPFKKDNDRASRPFGKPSFRKDNDSEGGERKPQRPFDKPFKKDNDRASRPFGKPSFRKDNDTEGAERKPQRPFDKPFKKDNDRASGDRPPRPFDKPGFKKNGDAAGGDRNPGRPADSRPFRERAKPAFGKPAFEKKERKNDDKKGKEEKGPRTFTDVVNNAFNQPPKSKDANTDDHLGKREQFEDKVYGELEEPVNETPKKPFELKKNAPGNKKHVHDHSEGRKKKYKDEDDDDLEEDDKEINQKSGPRLEMPLNKFIAHSGECSRRDAAELVRQGKVKVNSELVLDPGYRVQHDDKVTMSGKKLTPQKGMVYILLNKPKGFITTNDDPQGRKTVMQLVGNSGVDRLFPVGRLDRDTSGLLLITNDGDLTQKLCHPAYNIKKVYQVTLDKPLTKADFDKIIEGVEMEDGKADVDALSYLEKKNELGLEIHSGRNRIVRRIFESLGYVVDKLDRVMYAGLTKKNLPRSKWRYLDEREVVLLKHFKN